jgi:hypothetical protein
MALPFALTALVAVGVSLALQATLLRPAPLTVVIPTRVPATPAPTPVPPTHPPTPAASGDQAPTIAILRQEIADLRAGQDQLWTAIYLAKALNLVSDAETTLRDNDLAGVDQRLVAADDSLALAYERAGVALKDPIEERRREIDRLRDDLFLRPEGMDGRLALLRSLILALIEAGS